MSIINKTSVKVAAIAVVGLIAVAHFAGPDKAADIAVGGVGQGAWASGVYVGSAQVAPAWFGSGVDAAQQASVRAGVPGAAPQSVGPAPDAKVPPLPSGN